MDDHRGGREALTAIPGTPKFDPRMLPTRSLRSPWRARANAPEGGERATEPFPVGLPSTRDPATAGPSPHHLGSSSCL